MYSNFKEKAIEYVKDAVKEDNAGNYEEAFTLYENALKYFSVHLKYEKNERLREQIKDKFEEYLKRAEYLKELVQNKKENEEQSVAAEASTAVAKKAPKKGNNNTIDRDSENEKFQEALSSAIVTEKPDVKWDDVAGLEGAKEALKEAVILPVKFPQFFTGKRKPWSGILLYGPPGTGKSHLAKAVATEADSTFFSVTASDLVSKWMGESEKLVSNLFTMAKKNSPSIVFLDEVDSLCSARGDNESEAARRIKTQFLIEMQNIKDSKELRVLVLGATNLPYSLDQAVRRRFEKRIYIPLPDASGRAAMFNIHLGQTPHKLSPEDFQALGLKTEGFSGSDIYTLVKDVLMQPIRIIREAKYFRQIPDGDGGFVYVPCKDTDPGAKEMDLGYFDKNGLADKVQPPVITMDDFHHVLKRAKPTVGLKDLEVFQNFTNEFGEEG